MPLGGVRDCRGQLQTLAEALQQLARTEDLNACGRQLDRQRQRIESGAERDDVRHVLGQGSEQGAGDSIVE